MHTPEGAAGRHAQSAAEERRNEPEDPRSTRRGKQIVSGIAACCTAAAVAARVECSHYVRAVLQLGD